MKKKNIKKHLQRADGYMEEMERKIKCMESALFFLSLGLEYFHQQENCHDANTVQFISSYLKAVKDNEVAGLHDVLEKLKGI